jgi:hypothetical protein
MRHRVSVGMMAYILHFYSYGATRPSGRGDPDNEAPGGANNNAAPVQNNEAAV